MFDHGSNALPVRGRNGQHLTQSQFVKLGQMRAFLHAFGFVGHQNGGLAQTSQVVGNVVILCRHSRARIDDKSHHIGFGHGLLSLTRHFFVNAIAGIGLKTARVDDDEFVFAKLGIPVMPISGQPRKIGHDGIPRFGQSIEHRGFAHVGAAYQGQYGFQNTVLKEFAGR